MAEFDRFSSDYADQLENALGGLGEVDTAVDSKVSVLEAILPSTTLDHILDFGCGTGLLSSKLTRFANQVVGVDPSIDSLKHSKAQNSGRVAYDGCRLPFREGAFDAVVASCVFHHILPAKRATAMIEILRVLSPSGHLIIFEHNPYNPVTRWVVNRCEFDEDAILLRRNETLGLFRNAGFEQVRGQYFYALPPKGAVLSGIDSYLGTLPIGAQYYVHGQKSP